MRKLLTYPGKWLGLALLLFGLATTSTAAAPFITSVDSGGTVGWFTSLALNSSDYPIISYFDVTQGNLKLAVCGNPGCASGNTITAVDEDGAVGAHTSLVLNSQGNPVVSYLDGGLNGNLKLAVCSNPTCTNRTITTVDSAGYVGLYSSVALKSNDNPVISYYDFIGEVLKLAVCGNSDCSNKTVTTVDNAERVGLYSSLVLSNDGCPLISYHDDNKGDLKLAVYSGLNCGSKTITTIESGNNNVDVGAYTSLALNNSGYPVISYMEIITPDDPENESTVSNLKLAVCSNATCTTKTITVVDSGGYVGAYSSVVLNSEGYPIISYYDTENGSLKLAHCGDPTCAGKIISTIDDAGDVGQFTSLALSNNGEPVISYYDVGKADLKLVSFAESGEVGENSSTYLPLITK